MRRLPPLFIALCIVALVTTPMFAQKLPKVDLGQYKRIHQNALRLIVNDKADDAIAYLNAVAEKLPDDPETQFLFTVAHAKAGNVAAAEASMKKAIALGLPPGRFLAGPRELLAAVHGTDTYKAFENNSANLLIHGPMVGDVTDTSAAVWVRMAKAASVTAVATPEGSTLGALGIGEATAANDYTGVVRFTSLTPNTTYRYELSTADTLGAARKTRFAAGQFRTAPSPGKASKFTLAFGGGAGYVPAHEHMWSTIDSYKPDMLLLLGDNVYIDDPTSPDMQRYCYYRRQSRPEFRALISHTPVYSIWDDHDFSTNDSWGGPEIDEPKWKRPVFVLYRENWVNPAYGGGDAQPGCWYSFSRGDVDFFMLDCRYYRTDPKTKNPSMLGPVQTKWLLDTLINSKGTFKVICSSVPWTYDAKGASLDTWNGYHGERDELVNYITEHKIEGVLLMSADRHRTDLWKIKREGGYPLYEFNSSRLTNQHVHPEMKQAEFSYNKKQSFGLVTFDTTAADPTVMYDIMTIDKEKMHSVTIPRSSLK